MAVNKNITIKDIARATGVSPATVGRVFSSPDIVKQKTIDVVIAAAKELGYQPSLAGKALRTGKSYDIAVMLPFDRQGSSATMGAAQYDLIAAFSSRCLANGYNMKLLPYTSASERDKVLDAYLTTFNPDAFVITQLEQDDGRIARLQERQIPTVAFGLADEASSMHCFDFDNYAFVFDAVKRLLAQGRTSIAFVVSQESYLHYMHQLRGFEDAQQTVKPSNKALFKLIKVDVSNDSATQTHLQKVVQECDAIITISPHLVHQIKKIAVSNNRTIGQDLLVCCSTATPSLLEMLDIPIACYYQDFNRAGETLAQLAIESATGSSSGVKQVVIPYEFMELLAT
jgi:LacI family transcriptional regulator